VLIASRRPDGLHVRLGYYAVPCEGLGDPYRWLFTAVQGISQACDRERFGLLMLAQRGVEPDAEQGGGGGLRRRTTRHPILNRLYSMRAAASGTELDQRCQSSPTASASLTTSTVNFITLAISSRKRVLVTNHSRPADRLTLRL
jgi:hypothetical protein